MVALLDTQIKHVHKRLDEFGSEVQYMEYVAVLGAQKAEEKLTMWEDQIEEGLWGIHVEWKVQLERKLISMKEALRTKVTRRLQQWS